MYYIGLMSGTSMDAVDAVLTRIEGEDIEVIAYREYPIPVEIQSNVRSADSGLSIRDMTCLDVLLGELFAESALNLLDECGIRPDQVSAIGSHGQTVLHLPGATRPRTLQIGNPAIISVRTGITTVADFRRNDLAAGGQGAPLAPAFHNWRFRTTDENRIVLNLGGMANITVLPSDKESPVTGFDTGPGNALMDLWIQDHHKGEYDTDGRWAASGTVNEILLTAMLADEYFSNRPPKSTGKDYFNLEWIRGKINALENPVSSSDVQASLLELTARTVSDAVIRHGNDPGTMLICGGGVHNPVLVQRLKTLIPGINIVTTDRHGIDPDAVEAVTFAWLSKCRLDGVTGNLPSVTGAEKPVLLGGIYQA